MRYIYVPKIIGKLNVFTPENYICGRCHQYVYIWNYIHHWHPMPILLIQSLYYYLLVSHCAHLKQIL